jgi:hypothetical protein
MRQFIYKPSDLQLEDWPPGELRLDNIEVTEDPARADLFVCPGSLAVFNNADDLYRLPYFRGNERKHVFFDISDSPIRYYQPSIFMRCNLREGHFNADRNSIAIPWPAKDYADLVPLPDGGFQYDVAGHMWISNQARQVALFACECHGGLTYSLRGYDEFHGHVKDPVEVARREREYRRTMQASRVLLCGESESGVIPYRFFETLSAGRVPLLISSGYYLPFQDRIPYDSFILRCMPDYSGEPARMVYEFVKGHTDDEIVAMGQLARHYWERWLDSSKWDSILAEVVLQRLELVQCE